MFKSIAIICVVSVVAAAIANPVFGADYLKTFVAVTAVQLVLGFIASAIKDAMTTIRIKELQVQELESFAKQGMELKCAHCNTTSFVPIRLDEHNTFDCPNCNSANAIYVNVTVARETSMMNQNSIRSSSINDDESIAIRSIKDE